MLVLLVVLCYCYIRHLSLGFLYNFIQELHILEIYLYIISKNIDFKSFKSV